MQVNSIQANNYNNSQNFKGYVGLSMERYVDSLHSKELNNLILRTNNYQHSPVCFFNILSDRIVNTHKQVQNKLNRFMKQLDPDISMEYELGVIKLQNNASQKTLSFVAKDPKKISTGDIYGDRINLDLSNPIIGNSSEPTLDNVNYFANRLNIIITTNINKILAK